MSALPRSLAPAAADGTADRKADHIRLALEARMQLGASYFDGWRLGHAALPELDRAAIDTSVDFLGKRLRAPLLISCMTGGTQVTARTTIRAAAMRRRMCTPKKMSTCVLLTDAGSVFPSAGVVGKRRATPCTAAKCTIHRTCKFYLCGVAAPR